MRCLFASDLHGSKERYRKLLAAIRDERPDAVFLGGDLLPSGMLAASSDAGRPDDFLPSFLGPELLALRATLSRAYPRIFLILGNDDARSAEAAVLAGVELGLFEYVHNRRAELGGTAVYGYSCVPPTPFLLKDWERYDVSRYVEPGCVSPEEGVRTTPVTTSDVRFGTIAKDLALLTGDHDLGNAVFLCHTPPHRSKLDRAALDDKRVDHVPVDVHVGSIAVRRFVETRHPLLSLHGHVHESARLTGSWRDRIGATHMFTAAHDGPELALVRFALDDLDAAEREIL
jgi:Icc-related predicted phosphoesterase